MQACWVISILKKSNLFPSHKFDFLFGKNLATLRLITDPSFLPLPEFPTHTSRTPSDYTNQILECPAKTKTTRRRTKTLDLGVFPQVIDRSLHTVDFWTSGLWESAVVRKWIKSRSNALRTIFITAIRAGTRWAGLPRCLLKPLFTFHPCLTHSYNGTCFDTFFRSTRTSCATADPSTRPPALKIPFAYI